MYDSVYEPELQEHISAGQTLRVLVVDDSKVVRAAIRERLELGNLEVVEAESGRQALELIDTRLPDLVLLDMFMPGLDGTAVLRILRRTYTKQQLPVIPVTCRDSSTEVVRALDLGANDYITKPIDFDVLWARLSNQLMQKQASEYLRHAQKSLEHQIRQRTAELNSSNQKLRRVIQERLLAEDRLQRQANYDELTGLPNRSLAKDRLQQTVAKAKRQNLEPGIAFIDLDNFKHVNDSLGHAAGDKLLVEAATRLMACARKSDTVARLGGDEFILILEDSNRNSGASRELDLRRVGERIVARFAEPFMLEGHKVNVTPSIGFAIYPKDGDNGDHLMRHADAAMYRCKNDGKNSYCFYSADMTARAKIRLYVESRLRHALARGELSLHYQPVVDAGSGEIVMAEALLRWDNAELGAIAPDYFIGLADETGLIVPIGEWAIRSACEQVKIWRDAGKTDISVSVNISDRQLHAESGLAVTVREVLAANGLPADALRLELKEDVLTGESPMIAKTLEELKKMHISILIDDFGTGYASLSCLKRYCVDAVKIDRRFIRGPADDSQDAKLVRAITAMAASLGVSVIAEGVESATQLSLLHDCNCQYGQGHYFSRPLPADRFRDLVTGRVDGYQGQKPLRLASAGPVSCGV